MENNNHNENPYRPGSADGFGKEQQTGGREPERDQNTTAGEPTEERTSYYYSYGPFKSNVNGEQPGTPEPRKSPISVTSSEHSYLPEQPVQQADQDYNNQSRYLQAPVRTWDYTTVKRKSNFKGMFASFLAGAVVLGSLMVVSDKTNMFTADQGVLTPGSTVNSSNNAAPPASGSGNSATSAALDLQRPNNIAQLYQKASPAVVKIETFEKAQSRQGGGGLLDDPFFRQFFGDNFGGDEGSGNGGNSQQGTGELQPAGLGTGFIFQKDGYILTNQHVIGENPSEIQVTVEGNKEPFKAKLLGSSFDLDLAVLKIEGNNFPTLPLGKSDNISIGDWVVAIGNPYGFDHTVTVGVLSAKERPISISDQEGDRNYKNLLQTDAAINPGNSGGPLLNLDGEVIGINTAVSAQAQGIGFAIPTSTIDNVLEQLKNNKEIPKEPAPFIGVNLSDITSSIAQELGLKSTKGSIIASVPYNTPAYQADLRPYDVITEVDGVAVDNSDALKGEIAKHKVGDTVNLTVLRNQKASKVSVKIGDRNEYEKSANAQQQQQ
ncbi:S1C family serine protease [Paenibacillus gansuensis]|uniref:S1C family serine protease n=1 Tax=Paenibacillus gansuensis TaxID=306542 RepID=A0ABW5PEH1_9BACL